MRIDVRIEGLERLQAGAAAAPATLASEVRTSMTAGSLLIEGTARSLAGKDTGRNAGSITHRISGSGANLTSRIGPSTAYGYFAEKGRRPGKMPPVSAVEGWARRKGIDPFVLARSIARKGTKGKPYMVPSFQQNQGKVVKLFEGVAKKVVARMAG